MKRKVLITGATGDTGRAAVKEALALGLDVRAMVHSKDDRSSALENRSMTVGEFARAHLDKLNPKKN